MNYFKDLDSTLKQERSQSAVRVGVASVVLLMLIAMQLIKGGPVRATDMQAIVVVFVFWLFSIGWLMWLWRQQYSSRVGRFVALNFDIVATTIAMVLANEIGAFFYPVYQWIIIGHGVRFGRDTMLVACAMAVVGFIITVILAPYWWDNPFLASGLLLGLIVLPMYLTSLLSRLNLLNEQLQRELERTSHSARHDTLTGLPNRQTFFERLDLAIKQSKRSMQGFAVMFIDLDEFKDVNDQLGHLAGDIVLRTIADRLQQCCRETDLAGRFGGDEFALLVDNVTDCDDAAIAAQRIVRAISKPIIIENSETVSLTASIGISLFPADGRSPGELTHAADLAMYEKKRGDKNGYICFARLTADPA